MGWGRKALIFRLADANQQQRTKNYEPKNATKVRASSRKISRQEKNSLDCAGKKSADTKTNRFPDKSVNRGSAPKSSKYINKEFLCGDSPVAGPRGNIWSA